MKKSITSVGFIVAFLAYGLYQHFSNSNIINYGADTTTSTTQPQYTYTNTNTTVNSTTPQPTYTPPPTPPVHQTTPPPVVVTPPPITKPKGQYANGTYTGNVADAYYGYVQVRATVSGGKLTDVAFLQYPSDRGHSIMINNYAMPILKSEAIQAQSAQVDAVSGASATSGAFQESLGNALAQAKN